MSIVVIIKTNGRTVKVRASFLRANSMSTERDDSPQDPSPGEMDVLAVLWDVRQNDLKENNPRAGTLRLSDVYERVKKRREAFGEPASALTTVSTYLRSATAKRLLKELRTDTEGRPSPMVAVRTRGALSSTRSPRTAYQVIHDPGVVFQNTMRAIIQTYPTDQQHQALVDFARAMGLSQKLIKEVEKLVGGTGSA
jgi:predicted transcriptional regulator